ncbi:hypothetical protein [Nocardioides zeae]|uniref:Uncharacterized protein n=1 Tax=Nocardioides zeae TaxID=1457234 RepID=A0A6P0HGF2_9ACTN|nr:hypothetical protein [Nocardioides zeae]NEN77718.1 hypothetical protein [Nocardioides zeae]
MSGYGGPSPSDPAWSWQAPPGATGNPYGLPDPRAPRPGSVVAAGVITMVCSTGVALFAGAVAAFGALVSISGFTADDDTGGLGDAFGVAFGFAAAVAAAFAAWAVAAFVLGILVIRGSRVARWMLTASSVLVTLLMLGTALVVADVESLVVTVPGIVLPLLVVALLFMPGTTPWFAQGRGPAQLISAAPGYGTHGATGSPYAPGNVYGPPAAGYGAGGSSPYGQPGPQGGPDLGKPPPGSWPEAGSEAGSGPEAPR